MEHPEDESRSGGERHGIQDDEEAVVHVKEFKKSVEYKMTLRQSNLNSETPDPNFLRTLESSIKRNTAIIKKLKQINEGQRESLMDELQSVNLTKFVSEAVTAICDAKLRTSDIPAAVQICSLLHQRYKDFSPSLVKGLLKSFYPGKSEEEPDAADKNLQATKKRSSLKLLLELYYVGVLEDEGILVNLIKDLTSVDHLKDQEDAAQTNLPFLASFARQARHLLGLPQPGHEILEEGLNIAEDQKKFFSEAFHTYYYAVAELLHSNHTLLRQMEHENSKSLNVKGELSEEDAAAYVKLRKSYDRLYRGVLSLAEALDMQPPVIPEDGHTTRVNTGEDASSSPGTGKNPCIVEAIWDDEDTRTFYECLPDLRTFVPAVLFGESGAKVNDQSLKTQSSVHYFTNLYGVWLCELAKDLAPEPDQQMLTQDTAKASTAGSGDLQDGEKEKGKGKYGKDKEMTKDLEKGKEKQTDRKGAAKKKKLKNGLKGTNFDGLLHRLPGCVSRDLIDQLTIEFCYMNSKSKRKKLVWALFNVPRTSLELLAYYSRMVATLSTCMKDVSLMLLQLLEEEFNFLINKKDQLNIETKIRNIRFIGELCKFKIAPAGLVFSCLKACLDDFTHHNVDVACNLLETCGLFLSRSPETSIRMANMLEILMRLKKVKILDPHHSTLVDNAYYLCKPPERSGRISKVRPPLHQYIRKLLFSDLDKSSIEHVQTQLCKLPWSECGPYILKCFMKVHRGNYGQIHLIASLTAGLSQYHDKFAVSVVDEVLEEIRGGLELNNNGMQQRRIAHMRFLGELYNYKHVDSSVIFDTLYLILVFGHGTAQEDVLDQPEDCFRIRMVITLLETCGHHFDQGSSMRKLDQFLIHFQRYILSKVAVPLDIEFDLQDLFANLRPNMIRYSSIEEVNAALFVLEEHDSIVSIYKANNSEDYEEVIKESGSYSGTSTIHAEEQFDEREVDEENHIDAHDSKYDEVGVGEKVKEVDLEAAEFEREFRALIQESLDSRKLELRARPTLDMMIPMNVFDGPTKDYQGVEGESGDETSEEEGGEKSKEVRVKVLIKRGSKQRTKQMFIPRDCSLVHDTKQKEAAELEEKQDIKRLVLEYNERKEEEELNALGITLPTSLIQSGDGRVPSPGHTWQGHRQRGVGSRFRYFHRHSGAGHYYSRRR